MEKKLYTQEELIRFHENIAWRFSDSCDRSLSKVVFLSLAIITIKLFGNKGSKTDFMGLPISGIEEPILLGCIGWVWVFYILFTIINFILSRQILFKKFSHDKLFTGAPILKYLTIILLLFISFIFLNLFAFTLALVDQEIILVAKKVFEFLFFT